MLTVLGGSSVEVRIQLQNFKREVTVISGTHLKPHMKFHIPNHVFYRTDREDENKSGIVFVKNGIPHTCVDLPPLLSVEATGICVAIRNTEMFLAALYKSP
jgi:hypothetical protein